MWAALRFGFGPMNSAANHTWTTFDQMLRVFLEYRLLDTMAYTAGIRGTRPLSILASPSWLRMLKREATGKKVRRVCNTIFTIAHMAIKLYTQFLDDWPLHVDAALQLPERNETRSSLIESRVLQSDYSDTFCDPGSVFRREIQLLSRASGRDRGTSRRTAVINLELAAFAISVIQNVRSIIP